MLPSADSKFDYGTLPTEKAASARAAAERIRGRLNAAFIETGRDLNVQKDALGHGSFLQWVKSEFGMSERSAQHLMSVSSFVDANANHGADLESLSARALRELAAPSTPDEVRTEVIGRAAAGETVTAKQIGELRDKHKRATDTIKTLRSKLDARDDMVAIAERQSKEAHTRAMFAEADKERALEDAHHLQEEIGRLKEEGTIHVMPAPHAEPASPDPISQFNAAFAIPSTVETPWTDSDAQFRTIQAVWKDVSQDARQRFIAWAGLQQSEEMAA